MGAFSTTLYSSIMQRMDPLQASITSICNSLFFNHAYVSWKSKGFSWVPIPAQRKREGTILLLVTKANFLTRSELSSLWIRIIHRGIFLALYQSKDISRLSFALSALKRSLKSILGRKTSQGLFLPLAKGKAKINFQFRSRWLRNLCILRELNGDP